MPLYFIALELTILLTFWVCLGVLQQKRSNPGRATFVALGLAAIFWCAGDLVFYRELANEYVADRIKYLGVLAVAPLWAGLAAHLSRLDLARRVPWFPLVLMTPLAALYLLMFSESWSWLFMRTVPHEPDLYGPLWWVAAGYGHLLVLAGSGVLVHSALRRQGPGHWGRRILLALAPLIPLGGNFAYIASGMHSVDPTPLLFVTALVALRSATHTGGFLQALPVSQHDLLQQFPLGVILTDRDGVVIDVNAAAQGRLGISEQAASGRTLDAILSEAGQDVRAEIAPIFSARHEVGQLVLIDPPEKD